MKKILMGISIVISLIIIIIPLRQSIYENIQIDGVFEEWTDMPQMVYNEDDKFRINLKDVKYYMDESNLYLYFNKHYGDKKWNLIINISDNMDNNDQDKAENMFVLTEEDSDNSDTLDTYSIRQGKEKVSFIENKFYNNEVEMQIPLDKINVTENSIVIDAFIGSNNQMDLDEFYREELIITSGPVLGSVGSAAVAVISFIFTGMMFLI